MGLCGLDDLLGSFSITFTLGRSGAHSVETFEFPLLLLGNSLGHRGLVGIACIETLVHYTVILLVVLKELVLTGSVVGITASFSCRLFLLYSPCDVWTLYHWGVSALDFTTYWLHLPVSVACTQTGWVGSRLDFILAVASCLLYPCVAWCNVLIGSLLCGGLMMTGRVVFNCLLFRCSLDDDILL